MRAPGDVHVNERLLLGLVLLCTLIVYLPTTAFPFAADDASQILGNPRVHSWRYLPEYFKTHVWGHYALGDGEHGAAYYRPLFLIWELVVWMLIGGSAAGWHLAAIALHLLATALVWAVARAITREVWPAFFAALLFGLYPVHVEGVTWISGATEPLATIPLLASLWCWMREKRAASVALYGVALLAKETAIMLPFVVLAYELLLRPKGARVLRPLAAFAVVAAVYMGVRQMVLQDTAHTPISWGVLLLTWPSVVWFYIRHTLAPVRLALIYDLELQNALDWREVIVPALLAAAAILAAWRWVRGKRVAMFALVSAGLLLLPPLYLRAFTPVEIVHDRYLYMPTIGVCLAAGYGFSRLRLWTGLAAAGALAALFATGTVIESRPWADEAALFERCIQAGPKSLHAHRQLAFALERSNRCDDAMPMLAAILDRTPADRVAAFALGACEFHKGQLTEAERLMRQTVSLNPQYPQPYLLLATILIGDGRLDEAEELWRRSGGLHKGTTAEPSFHLVRAELLKARGDLRGAIGEYRRELEIQPGNAEILGHLQRAEMQVGERVN